MTGLSTRKVLERGWITGFVIFQVASSFQLVNRVFPILFNGHHPRYDNLPCTALHTVKRFAACAFAGVVEAVANGEHKTKAGIERIRSLKEKLNRRNAEQE